MYSSIYPRKPRARRNHRRIAPAANPAPPAALVLVAASYDGGEPSLLMTFDVAINIDALDYSQIMLDDEPIDATFAQLDDPWTVEFRLEGAPPASPVLLSATGATGIVASDGGAMWAGVTDLPLPFP